MHDSYSARTPHLVRKHKGYIVFVLFLELLNAATCSTWPVVAAVSSSEEEDSDVVLVSFVFVC